MKTFTYIYLIFFLANLTNAQNIVQNGNFDNNIIGWHCGSFNPIWIADDGAPLSGDGSLQHSRQNFVATGGTISGGHCDWISVTAGKEYIFDGLYKVLVNSAQANVMMDLYWYTEDETYISVDSLVIPDNTITKGLWTLFLKKATAPQNATKLSLSLGVEFNSGGQTESTFIRWDDLSLIIKLEDKIFANGFE